MCVCVEVTYTHEHVVAGDSGDVLGVLLKPLKVISCNSERHHDPLGKPSDIKDESALGRIPDFKTDSDLIALTFDALNTCTMKPGDKLLVLLHLLQIRRTYDRVMNHWVT